jgi:hypothetical protein
MTRLSRALAAVACTFSLAACHTPYQPMGFGGGFTEARLDARTIQVMVRGNGFTGRGRVDLYVMYRCAELTVMNGFDYFFILGGDAQAHRYVTPGHLSNGVYYAGSTYTKHESTKTFWMLSAAEAPRYPGAYQAREMMAALYPQIQ